MDDEIGTLEKCLLEDPFDALARREYARLLLVSGRPEESLKQWRLLIRQEPRQADSHLAAAECAAQLADQASVGELLEAARACADFVAEDPRLAQLQNPEKGPALRAITGGKRDQMPSAGVVSIRSSDSVRFSDVVGMENLKKLIRVRIIEPFIRPGLLSHFGRVKTLAFRRQLQHRYG